jgi:hypothetical protein
MQVGLADDDIQLMLTEIRRFCQRAIQPLVERPEHVLPAPELDRLTHQAREIGLVNLETEAGAGLWEDTQDAGWVKFSGNALRCLAHANAGIAFHFHQLALGRLACRALRVEGQRQSIVCLQGVYGLARHSLARLLKGRELNETDRLLLDDYFVCLDTKTQNHALLFQAAPSWQRLLVPCWNERRQFGWALYEREDLDVVPREHSHGLNETLTWQWQPPHGQPACAWIDRETDGLALYGSLLHVNAQALVAIASGTLQLAYQRALEYASLRKQGGHPIREHAAVRQMLGTAASVKGTVGLLLEQLACLPVTTETLGTVFSVRAQAHDLICAAANDALQVLGGSGYTLETGLEKTVRDCNHLRLLCGTPSELLMFVSEWENEE